ncbi:hypothetical protein [Eisenibacter elegans]|jgi:tetratricopeptide (TPR) repeat protein|uniref:hypothetical protein n=1 Tax=Eisenibacter elegans TaxID=997 RepID=UPI0003FF50A5|nr:hypothetical protein [Eisenibacter elegans]
MHTGDHGIELDKLFYQADQEIKDGNISQAFDTLTYIIEQDARYGKAYNHLGWMYETKYKNYHKAEECYRLARRYAPEYTAVYLNYAVLLSTLERWNDLQELLHASLEVPGINRGKIWNEFGIMYEMQLNYDEAVEAYKNAIRYSIANEDIDTYRASIERCNNKQALD